LQLAVFGAVRFSLTEGAGIELGQMLVEVKLLVHQYFRALVAEYGSDR